MSRQTAVNLMVFVLLLLVVVAGRLLPHPPNFTPAAGAALFAGFFFARRSIGLLAALAPLALSDLLLGGYEPGVMAVVYASLAFPIALRALVRTRLSPARIAGCALASSLVFFITTNFAHWLFAGWYPLTPDGLAASYLAGLPFLKYTVAGDLLWSAGFFGAYAVAMRWVAPGERRGALPA